MSGWPLARTLRARPGQFAGLLVLVAVTVALVASFASFRAAAGTSILRHEVAAAPPLVRGVEIDRGVSVGSTTFTPDQFFDDVRAHAAALPASARAVPSIEVQRTVVAPHLGFALLTWRPDACAHLRITTGRCPSRGETIVNEATARLVGWRVGTRLTLNDVPKALTVSGLYRPPADDPYWFGNVYFTPQGIRIAVDAAAGTYDAFIVGRDAVDDLPAGSRTTFRVAFGIDAGRVTRPDVAALRRLAADETQWGRRFGATVTSPVDSAVRAANRSYALLTRNAFVLLAQLALVLVVVLFVVTRDVLASRWQQVAVLRFRGVTMRRTVALVLGDLVLALLLGCPLGVAVGGLASTVLARWTLAPYVAPHVGAATWSYALATLAVAFVACSFAFIGRMLQERRGDAEAAAVLRRRGWVVDVALAAVAVAGGLELFGRAGSGGTDSGAFLALPGVAALLVALLLSRGMTWMAGAATRLRVTARRLALYIGLRQIARLGLGERLAVVVVSGSAFVTFAAAQYATLHGNYDTASLAAVGAVSAVEVPADTPLSSAVRVVDPTGRSASAGYVTPRADLSETATVAVDTRTYAAVAGGGAPDRDLRAVLARLRPQVAAPILVRGDRLEFTLAEVTGPADLRHDVVVTLDNKTSRRSFSARAGSVTAGHALRARASLVGCYPSCELRAITLTSSGSPAALQRPEVALTLRLSDVSVVDRSRRSPVDLDRRAPSAWRGYTTEPAPQLATFSTPPGVLEVRLHGDPLNPLGFAPATFPVPLPAVAAGAPVNGSARGLDGALVPVHALATVRALPAVLTNGYLVDADLAARAGIGVTDDTRAQIWLSKAVPASVAVARLHAAGIRVVGSSTASDLARDYRGSGPGLAAALSLMAGIAVAGVTFVAALLTIASAIRRRARELWPLAQVGASTRSILGYLTLEQAMLVLPGVVAGAVAGAVAARLVTSRVAEYVVPPAAPPPAFPLHLPVALVVVLLAFVLLLPVVVLVSHRAHAAAAHANGMGDQP